jgi:uncharacterized protein
VRLTVRVHPRASRQRVRGDGVQLELWVTAPAVDGAANRAVIAAVATWAGVRRGDVRLVAGERSRTKVVEVNGLTETPPARLN